MYVLSSHTEPTPIRFCGSASTVLAERMYLQ